MRNFKLTSVTLAMLALIGAAQAQQATDIGKITVTGEGDKLGTGLLIDEDTPKAKSTVTKAQIDKLRSSSNPFQDLALQPGVNATSYDATGLFGGNLRVRGFNSDQMGFTINGAPVNDSGSFSVFPQEYSDSENLCEVSITQGATDTEAPHVGASGGNVSLVTCSPEDVKRFRVGLSAGSLHYYRTFFRLDTGKIGDFKSFLSYSKSEANKFKGNGKADRDHVDAGAEYDLGKGSKLSASVLYNRALTNNFRSLTYVSGNIATATVSNGGLQYYSDFANQVPQHLPAVAGTAQNESQIAFPTSTIANGGGPAYFGYSLNPFRNYLWTAKANLQLNERLRLDIEPYYWYGYGTGGTQQTSIAEGGLLKGGVADINGDGDKVCGAATSTTCDTVMIYRGSVTETHRPGVTTKLSYTLDNQKILGGFWIEKAHHKQTAPGTRVGNDGSIGDQWLSNTDALLRYSNGELYQNRNTSTISTGESAFLQDSIDLLNSKLQLIPSVSYRRIHRDFTNFASGVPTINPPATSVNNSSAVDYKIDKTYSKVLPSLNASYTFIPEVQGFIGVAQNMKAPGNFDYFTLAQNVTFANGVGTAGSVTQPIVDKETSTNVDAGFRYKGDMFKGSITGYYVKFKNRIASAYDPVTTNSRDYNVGNSTIKGAEFEAGTVPYNGFSGYVSASYTKSTMDNNMIAGQLPNNGAFTFYATAGKQFPDTPKGMAALSLQYAAGPYLANISAKYTSGRQLTLINDAFIKGYTTFDFNGAYKIPGLDTMGLKNPVVRLNVSNIFSRKYYIANSGSGSTIALNAAGNPSVYSGAPRFTSVTFQADY